MNTNELRQRFLEYFIKQEHTLVPSSPLIPANDPTLLFTNAGMVQFKDVFLGHEQRPYQRATSSQRCVRAGGKHNDLDNVGYTARHHTFFEMLGNFSFGDYFKREAIQFAWDFLTNELKIPKEKLWITVHITDQEAEDIWLKEIGADPTRFSRCDEDNFWSMGEVGPCGPCTEIFYDHGAQIPGGPPGSPDQEGDRYVEVWNLVFMQFNRTADGSMTPLPKPSVDTGMGLERIAAVMQGVHSNYDIDLFKTLIAAAGKIIQVSNLNQPSLRVIADHIRSSSFLIVDGVRPSNEGRGYVLRRIIRRAARHGYKLGVQDIFLSKLVPVLVQLMGDAYPELKLQQTVVEKVLQQEEQQFSRTLAQGMRIFQQAVAVLKTKELPGDVVFKLYDTYGFPVDLCADMAREHGLTLDMPGFEICMEQQRSQSQAHSHFVMAERLDLKHLAVTEFTGYQHLQDNGKIVLLLRDGQPVDKLLAGEKGIIILDRSPFYPEGGGQVGDVGAISNPVSTFTVQDTTKQDAIILHHGLVTSGEIITGTEIRAEVNASIRTATRLNHSATHLLHAALRNVLGTHVVQKGSLVNPDYLRFDFSHFTPITAEEITAIELQVNDQIRMNTEVNVEWLDKEQAMERGALALFEEKYGDEVRVLTMGDKYSVELCGGTHVQRTGDIGLFKIIQETGIAAGVRRLEAVTGAKAVAYILAQDKQLRELGSLLKTPRDQITHKVQQTLERTRELEKEIERWQSKNIHSAVQGLLSSVQVVNGINVLATTFNEAGRKGLREAAEQVLHKLENAIICLAAVEEGQVGLLVAVSKNLTAKFPANELMKEVAQQVGGKGGGRPDMAQGAGNLPDKLPAALESVSKWLE
ncbi:MAG: alanine--tRNA ligase, partial [Gammaproteobacteria bacterium]